MNIRLGKSIKSLPNLAISVLSYTNARPTFGTRHSFISRHSIAMPKGLYFTSVVSSFFRCLISEVTELNLNQIWTHIHL